MKTNHRFNGFAVFFAAIFAALAFAFVMAGCEQPTSPADSFVPVTGITGVPDTGAAGTELDLTGARVEPYNATGQTIVWTVKNAGTTGVTAITGGKATPATAGILIVTATIANGRAGGQNHTQDFTINIGAAGSFVPVTGISGVPPAMVKNTELDLNAASVTPANATNKTIAWTLIDAGTTGVTAITDGKLSPTAAGTLVLTATVTNGQSAGTDYTRNVSVIVTDTFVPAAGITGVSGTGMAGTPINLATAAVTPNNATRQTITWVVKAPNTTNASINGGTVTAAGAGALVLTAVIANGQSEGQDYTQDFTITISLPFIPVTGINGVPTGGVAGAQIDLTAVTVAPANATNKTIVWTVKSAGTTGVTTITDGKATPAAAGTLVLTATIAKGKSETEDYTQEFTLTITGTFVPATGITGVPETGLVDQELDLTAVTVTPNDATNKTITWSVQDAGGTGVTTGDLADGKATPTGAGALKVLAVIVKGGANQTDFTNVFTITVSVPFVTVTGITGVPDTGVAGTQIDLTGAEVTPNTATNKTITWTVKDAGTTGLTAGPITGGTVTPATAGTLKLTATVANGTAVGTDYTKDFILTIAAAPVPVTGITGVPDTGVAGTQIDLTGAEVTPANATNKTIKWTVKDMGGTGATITNGKATPSLGGTLVLTATIAKGKADSTDYTQDFSIAIIMPVQGIQNVPTVPGLVGKSINLSGVTVTPDTATNKGITWSVKAPNSTNAAVSGSTVTAASAGTLTLTATVANGKAVGTPYTEDIELVIGTALLLQKTGTTETIVDAVYDGDLDGVFAWINENAEANDKYVVLLGADQAIAPYFSPGDPGTPPNFESTDAGKAGIEITLRGHGAERKISWDGTSKTESQTFGQGLFNLWNNNALILDNNITLDGKNTGLIVGTASYELPMIYMNNAHLTMNTGSKITGVKVPDYGAVTVAGSVTGGIVLAGGEINGNTASYGIQVGNPSLSTNYTFTMTSGAIKNNTGIGLFLRLADGAAAMSGGTISGNKVGIHLIDAVFTMTGGTIRDNTATIGGGIRFVGAANSGAFYLNGNVTIDNNGVALEGSPTAKYNTVIYIGGNFNAVGTIAIDVHSYNESDFTATWGSASGHVFLKGGTADNPTAVTGVQAAKFTAGKACNTSYALSTSGDETEKTGGALSITGLNTDNYGVAKWE